VPQLHRLPDRPCEQIGFLLGHPRADVFSPSGISRMSHAKFINSPWPLKGYDEGEGGSLRLTGSDGSVNYLVQVQPSIPESCQQLSFNGTPSFAPSRPNSFVSNKYVQVEVRLKF
jgi:hypothetical protein